MAIGSNISFQENAWAIGGQTNTGDSTYNIVTSEGSLQWVAGGKTEIYGVAEHNQVRILNGTVAKGAYGGQGSLRANYNTVTVDANSKVEGLVVGGLSSTSPFTVAEFNTVSFNGSSSFDGTYIYGGQGGYANNNIVYLNSTGSFKATDVAGGWAEQSAENNKVYIFSTLTSNVRGGVTSGPASANQVIIGKGGLVYGSIEGAYLSGTGNGYFFVRDNLVSVASGGSVRGSVFGASADKYENGVYDSNSVEIAGCVEGQYVGGAKAGSGTFSGNSVKIAEGSYVEGIVFGGWALRSNYNSELEGNYVSVSGQVEYPGSSSDTALVYGVRMKNGSAYGNTVTIENKGTVNGDAYGVYADGSGGADISSNKITVSGSAGQVAGGRIEEGNSQDNQTIVKAGGTVKGDAVGSIVKANGTASNNGVIIESGAKVIGNARASSLGNGENTSNRTIIYGSVNGSAYGAKTKSGSSDSNTVFIGAGGEVKGDAVGSAIELSASGTQPGQLTASKNSVTVDGTVGGNAAGAWVTSDVSENDVIINGVVKGQAIGALSENGSSTSNHVYLRKGSSVKGNVSGGQAKSTVQNNSVLITDANNVGGTVYGGLKTEVGAGDVSGNIVLIDGSTTVDGDVYGGYSEGGGTLSNNSVSLSGNVAVKGTVFSAYDKAQNPIGNENVLVFSGRIKAGSIGGFTGLHLLAEADNRLNSGDEYLLTITGADSLDLTGKNIDVYDLNNTITASPDGAKYGLIKIANSQSGSSPAIKLGGDVVLHNTFIDKIWKVTNEDVGELYIEKNKIVIQPPSDDSGDVIIIPPTSTSANLNSHSLSQNRLASIASVNQGATFAADSGIEAMKDQLYGKNWFFVTEGGINKYGHGFNKIEFNGASMMTGLMNNFSGTIVGGFFEASWGHAASKENVFSAKSNIQSYGGGILVNKEFDSNLEIDGSFRIGWLRNAFKGRYFDVAGSSDFKTRMLYLSAHVGAAYNFPLSETTVISPYARYIVSYLGSDKVNASNVERDIYKASSTVSHTLRAGLRVKTQITENFKFVGGLAIDETMGAKAKGRISGYDLKTLSVNGTTGVGELKLQAAPSASSPWKFDLGVKGYVGARRGVQGEASINYRF